MPAGDSNQITQQLADLIRKQNDTLAQLQKTIASRTPQQEFKYGQDFTGTKENFSSRRLQVISPVATTSTVIRQILFQSTINHRTLRFQAALTVSTGVFTRFFILECSNDGRIWNPEEVLTVGPLISIGTTAIWSEIFETRHRFFRLSFPPFITIGDYSTSTSMGSVTNFSAAMLPRITFLGE